MKKKTTLLNIFLSPKNIAEKLVYLLGASTSRETGTLHQISLFYHHKHGLSQLYLCMLLPDSISLSDIQHTPVFDRGLSFVTQTSMFCKCIFQVNTGI